MFGQVPLAGNRIASVVFGNVYEVSQQTRVAKWESRFVTLNVSTKALSPQLFKDPQVVESVKGGEEGWETESTK